MWQFGLSCGAQNFPRIFFQNLLQVRCHHLVSWDMSAILSHIYQKYPEKMSQLTLLLTYFCLNRELKKFDNIIQNWEGDYKDYQRSTLPQVLKKKKWRFISNIKEVSFCIKWWLFFPRLTFALLFRVVYLSTVTATTE